MDNGGGAAWVSQLSSHPQFRNNDAILFELNAVVSPYMFSLAHLDIDRIAILIP